MPNAQGLYTPGEIGLRADYAAMHGEDLGTDLELWVIHWPGGSQFFSGNLAESMRALRAYEDYHLSKKWRGIAYDYAVDLSGHLFLLRGTGQSGATSGDYDEDGIPNNRESDGILLLLGPNQEASPAMLAAVGRLLAWDTERGVIGHGEARGTKTSCPGPAGMKVVSLARQRLLPGQDSKEEETMKRNDNAPPDKDVEFLQARLNWWNYKGPEPELKPDGVFGANTEKAVKAFQARVGLRATGVVNLMTAAALTYEGSMKDGGKELTKHASEDHGAEGHEHTAKVTATVTLS